MTTNGSASRGVKRRWPLAMLAGMLLLISAAAVYVVISARTVQGAIPGKAPVLSLASTPSGFLVGTSRGAFASGDGKLWRRVAAARSARTLVAGDGGAAFMLSDGRIRATDDLRTFRTLPGRPTRPTAAAADGSENLILAAGRELILLQAGRARSIPLPGELAGVIALDWLSGNESMTIFAGGLNSGLWRARGSEPKWRRAMKTPVRAVAINSTAPDTVLVATSGGILLSGDHGQSWRFTEMRIGVEAMAQGRHGWYAISEDRLLFRSPNGSTGWTAVI